MRITIQVTCDTPEEAQDAIARLTRPRTWEDDVKPAPRVSEARLEQIMGEKHEIPSLACIGPQYGPLPKYVPPQGEPRPNVSPGEPSIGKIGPDAKQATYNLVTAGEPIPKKYEEHAKLLWKRGDFRFDGKEYYL